MISKTESGRIGYRKKYRVRVGFGYPLGTGGQAGPPEVEQEVLADLKKSSGWPNHRGEVLEGNRRGQCQRLPTQDNKGEVTKRGLRATEKLLRPTKIEEVPFRWWIFKKLFMMNDFRHPSPYCVTMI